MKNTVGIHFDGWSDRYDYEAAMTDPNLRPVGYCEWKQVSLAPPHGNQEHNPHNAHVNIRYTGYQKAFDWMKYLAEEKVQAVAYELFTDVGQVN